MPEFYEKMKNKLRTVEEGADTIVWLAVSPAARQAKSGDFFQDRVAVSEHLPLAWSKSKVEEDKKLMKILDGYYEKFSE